MRRYYLFGCVHFAAAVASWYFIAAMAQGVADGTGVAPTWLLILRQLSRVFTLPLIDLVVALDWFRLSWWTVGGFLGFAALAAINSALVTAGLWLVMRSRS